MNTKSPVNINVLYLLLLGFVFFNGNILVSQNQGINKPQLLFNYICAEEDYYNNFPIKFTVYGFFNNGAKFSVYMSDKTGSFSGKIKVAEVPFVDGTFEYKTNITLPKDPSFVYGDSFKIKISSSSPVVESPESEAFSAHYTDVPKGSLKLNDGNNIYFCDGERTKDISLNITDKASYRWVKNGKIIPGEQSYKLTVSEEGTYYAYIYYGEKCGDLLRKSNRITVTKGIRENVAIEGKKEINVCPTQNHTFKALPNDTKKYKYQWYKDGKEIKNAIQPTYTTGLSYDRYGTYYVMLSNKGCKASSNEVKLIKIEETDFEVTLNLPEYSVFLPNEKKEVTVSHQGVSQVTYKWYRNNRLINEFKNKTHQITLPGEYHVEVKDTSIDCGKTIKSKKYTILNASSFKVIIEAEDYKECESEKTNLKIKNIKALATNSKLYNLTDKQLKLLTYKWYKNNAETENTKQNYKLNSYKENDTYQVEAKYQTIKEKSNKITVKLTLKKPEIKSTSPNNALCKDSKEPIILSFDNIEQGFTYKWYKNAKEIKTAKPNEVKVNEIGTYQLKIAGKGCELMLNPIKIVTFNEELIKIIPEGEIKIVPNQNVVLKAKGATKYKWYNQNNSLISSADSVTVNQIGIYKLVAKEGNCEVTKTIEINEKEGGAVVPTVISPNGDGVNDLWELPNQYAYQPNVQVIIFNANGKQVYKTKAYENNWPQKDIKGQILFYYQIIRNQKIVKAGTISILE